MVDTRKVVVDGSNVAHEETSDDGAPRVANIVRMRQELVRLGYSPTIIIDASLRHDIDDPEQLEGLIDNGIVHQAPADAEADYFILETARREGSLIVSNDTFSQYSEEHPWIEERRVPFMIIHGDVQIHTPDLDRD